MPKQAKPSVRFYTNCRKQPEFKGYGSGTPYHIIVSYNNKRLAIHNKAYAPGLSVEEYNVFKQLKSDGTPKDPNTKDKDVLELSERLVFVRELYETALDLLIVNKLWESDRVTAKFFPNFLQVYYQDILYICHPEYTTLEYVEQWRRFYKSKELKGVKELRAKYQRKEGKV